MKKYLTELAEELETISNRVYDINARIRDDSRKYANKRITPSDLQYQIGEYVMVSRIGVELFPDKLKLIWRGPYLIEDIVGHDLYKLISPTDDFIEVHSRRVRYYDGFSFEFDEVVKKILMHDHGSQEIERFVGLRLQNGEYQLKCRWRGLEEGDDTWQEAKSLIDQYPS